MGIFDKLKKQTKQPEQRNKGMYSMITQEKNSNDEIMAFNIEKINSIKHRNNELTDLIMTRIIKQNPEDTIYVDLTDYIAFEVPKGMEITNQIMQIVMSQYEEQLQGNSEQRQYYIGRLINDRNGYSFGNKSAAVENIVNQTIQKRIQQRREQIEKRLQERKQEEDRRNAFLADIDESDYLNKFEEKRNKRKQFPTLERVYSPFNGQGEKQYSNYDGINVNTGDILRIRQVDKVGKDGSGTYLYSAYIHNTPNEDDVEIVGETPMGVAVCFELQKRLEDIVNDGDINEITQVLQLLSDGRNFENPEQLNYIGGIDKAGQVNRRAVSSSSAIQSTIEKMQRKFVENNKTQQKGRENY